MDCCKSSKIDRVLDIYTRLMDGQLVNKMTEADHFGVNGRTIQRDIDDIRNFLQNDGIDSGYINSVVYDYQDKGFRLEQVCKMRFTNNEFVALSKIILNSKAYTEEERKSVLQTVTSCCLENKGYSKSQMYSLISDESFSYIEPENRMLFLDTIRDLGIAIDMVQYVEFDYENIPNGRNYHYKIKPVSIVYSNFYFYLVGLSPDCPLEEDKAVPMIFRIDYMDNLELKEEHFTFEEHEWYTEDELGKRIKFRYDGAIKRIEFRYDGEKVNDLMESLPTATVEGKDDKGYLIGTEIFSKSMEEWLRKQDGIRELIF